MSLKLFRATEFAESRNFSPQLQRIALHPVWIVVLTSLWVAVAGNWSLWRELAQLSDVDSGFAKSWLMLRLVVLLASATCVVLGLFMWRRSLKLAATLMLVATAWAHTMQGGVTAPGSWQMLTGWMLIAVLPAVALWRTPVRRLPPWRNLVQVGSLVASALAIFALALLFSFKDLAKLSRGHAELFGLLNPYSATGAVEKLEKILLPRKQ